MPVRIDVPQPEFDTNEEKRKAFKHTVMFPPGADVPPSTDPIYKCDPPLAPVYEFPFALDPFQKCSVGAVHRDESVLVSAHTSAGKTAVAEYAIAQALNRNQRVIYTSPIKALSNQKFRDLAKLFPSVGLQTGDTTVRPDSDCVVMTTEVLRSMLYQGAEVMREVGWVIFDEIHYMRDPERGVVWEETIISLPHKVKYVFLSATLPNAAELAGWVSRLHTQPVHVVYTEFRPVPLCHYVVPVGGKGMFLVKSAKSEFNAENFAKATSTIASARKGKGSRARTNRQNQQALTKVLQLVAKQDLTPAICFAFGRSSVERLASKARSMDLLTQGERTRCNEIIDMAKGVLQPEERELNQIVQCCSLLQRGIGVHHSGLLPWAKEITEILFQEGLVRILFATETFAMGLNLPARTCIFSEIRKYDGVQHRPITSGEYIQMAGRAGRRGQDKRGIVITMMDPSAEAKDLRTIITGKADTLRSAFRLSYSLVLNAVRLEGADPKFILRKSFLQYQVLGSLPEIARRRQEELDALQHARAEIQARCAEFGCSREDAVELRRLYDQKTKENAIVQGFLTDPKVLEPYLNKGRLVRVVSDEEPPEDLPHCFWGVISEGRILTRDEQRYVKCWLAGEKNEDAAPMDKKMPVSFSKFRPPRSSASQEPALVLLPLNKIRAVSAVRLTSVPTSPLQITCNVHEACERVSKSDSDSARVDDVPVLDPFTSFKIEDEVFKKAFFRVKTLEQRIEANALHAARAAGAVTERLFEELLEQLENEEQAFAQVKALARELDTKDAIVFSEDLTRMISVLRRLDFVDDSGVTAKGRVGCELNVVDELVVVEAIFLSAFKSLDAVPLAAALSSLICEDKENSAAPIPPDAAQGITTLAAIAQEVGRVCEEFSVKPPSGRSYQEMIRPRFATIVHAWALGRPFAEVHKLDNGLFEGEIIRGVRRLAVLLEQLSKAAATISAVDLQEKFDAALKLIKRGIMFIPSLYVTDDEEAEIQ
eukprot:gnl/Chilomastix_cuspidata/610.p1 GENE.gnl/Chilomastix_cuspidata/610~~gnl/Chilomastix_cuspidata/610.p1  ORF type:complete len:1065 (-),score=455.37 gnl/Chilomastix_cuspidata/610:933-3917(-)